MVLPPPNNFVPVVMHKLIEMFCRQVVQMFILNTVKI